MRDQVWIVAIVAIMSTVVTYEIVTHHFAILTKKVDILEAAIVNQDVAINELERMYGVMRRDIYTEWMKGVKPK